MSTSHIQLTRGDQVGNYKIIGPIGRGRVSSVWAATYNDIPVAVKFYRKDHVRQYDNEVGLFHTIRKGGNAENIVKCRGYHIDGVIHPSIVLDLHHDNLANLIDFTYEHDAIKGVPLHIAKPIMRDILSGLIYLHSIGIIHADIKPDNILLSQYANTADGNIRAYIADFGSSTVSHNLFSLIVGTNQYRSPELIIEVDYTTATDIWAACITFHELATNDYLFDAYEETNISYGSEVATLIKNIKESSGGSTSSSSRPSRDSLDEPMLYDENWYEVPVPNHTGNTPPLFDFVQDTTVAVQNIPVARGFSSSSSCSDDSPYDINYIQLLLIQCILGQPPDEFTNLADEYYTPEGTLLMNENMPSIPLDTLLEANYGSDSTVALIKPLLHSGLKYSSRGSAQDLLSLLDC
jgi:serine/threonine protein kinase